ncbi:MAG: DNA mismatch repair protein MutS [Prevotella sp.]|nr:DNA mismatch repair protein MutS [Prevotella sp.]
MKREEIKAFYEKKVIQLGVQIARLRSRNRLFIAGEIITFLVAIGFVVLYTVLDDAAWALWMVPVWLVAYVVVRRFDEQNDEQTERMEALQTVYKQETGYLNGDFSPFDDGECYVDARHPYSFDMDVFGRNSLFQCMNRTITTGGNKVLAGKLSTLEWDASRSRSLKELASMAEWRMKLIALGHGKRIDTAELSRIVREVSTMKLRTSATSRTAFAMVVVALAAFWLSIAGALLGLYSGNVPFVWSIIQYFVVFLLFSGSLRNISKTAGKLHKQLNLYVELLQMIREAGFKETLNRRIAAELEESAGSFKELKNILARVDRRSNELCLFLFDALFLNDFFIVRDFLHWQQRYIVAFDTWIRATSEMDALVSMATFAYNEPSAVEAEVVDSDAVVYETQDIRHPFLGEKGIGNDFNIENTHYYIITGANMAGKSTFLRALGVNYILAMNGLPVFAKRLRVSVFQLFTSMRTTDDLAHGISYFNAELRRLQQLLEVVAVENRPVLIILDEILKGTNSLDKLNGSRMFLEHVSRKNVSGVVATHDLELSKMADERPDRFHNYCFEIELGTQVTYTYKLTEGIARNQNATFLLRNILK